MEDILQKCCKADNDAIQQGTQELKEALKKPEAIAALCHVVVTAQEVQIRQYAAVVLGRRMAKYRHWAKISTENRAVIKQGILQALVNEPHKPVRNNIAYFIGMIMKHEAPKAGWPELEQALSTLPSSDDPAQRELGLYLLSILVDMNPKLFIATADKICAVVASIMNTVTDMPPPSNGGLTLHQSNDFVKPEVDYALDILKSLALGTENIQVVVNTAYEAVPVIIKAIYVVSRDDEDRAIKFIQLLDNFSDSVPLVFVPHLKRVVEMCLMLAKEERLGDQVRMKAMALLGLLVTKMKKSLIKHNLVQPILDTLFMVVATCPQDPLGRGCVYPEEFEDEEDTPSTVANQTLDSLALNLPPAKVVIPMLKHIEAGMESMKPYPRKAACLSMAVMAEGCAEYIRTKHLSKFIQYVLKGIEDDYAIVRNAALFALGQFSEHLQPDISNYSEHVMPVLFSYLDNLCRILEQAGQLEKHPEHITRMFYALEMFCENLNERLTPYLPSVVERLLTIFVSKVSVKIRELAISALNSAASAAKERMAPYVPKILESLHRFLTTKQDDELISLQIHSVDTLAVLARYLGKDNFRPLAGDSLRIAISLIDTVNDPDLRRTTYGLLGALSGILEKDMEGVLEHVVTIMLGALKSEAGNTILEIEERDENPFCVYDDVSDENDEEDIEEDSDRSDELDGCQVHVEDAFTEEKGEACSALGELAKNTGSAFLPYFEGCFSQLKVMIGHPSIQVRCDALDAFAEMVAAFGAAAPDKEQEQQMYLSFIVPKCAELIQTDYERDVVAAALDALDTLLVKVKEGVLQAQGHQEAIVNSILQVLTGKTRCQDDADEPTDEDGESEQDEVLFEYAGNVIPALGKAMPHDRFLELFKLFLPLLLSKAKENSSTAQKSFVVGTLAETLEILGDYSANYFDQLFPLFMNFSNVEEDEVRNNAVFALGELVLHSKEAAYPSYSIILIHLSKAISCETIPANLDNVCGALARMIIANPSGVHVDNVLPALVDKLPLREDFEENLSIFQCFNLLYQMGNPTMKRLIPAIIRVAITVVYRKDHTKPDTLHQVVNLLLCIKRDFPDKFAEATSELSEEQLLALNERLSSLKFS